MLPLSGPVERSEDLPFMVGLNEVTKDQKYEERGDKRVRECLLTLIRGVTLGSSQQQILG